MTEVFIDSLQRDLWLLWQMVPRLAVGLLVFFLLVWLGRVAGRTMARVAQRSGRTQTYDRFLRHLGSWAFGLAGLAIALQLAGLGHLAAGMLAAGGVAAIVFGFAFREIGENLLAGLFLSVSRSFEEGDLIQSGEWAGEVRNIELRQVHIRTADGRDIFVPCAQVYRNALVNFTRDGLRAPRFTVGIDYADNAQEACGLLLRTTNETNGVLADPPASAIVTELAPQYVELTVFFGATPFRRGSSSCTSKVKSWTAADARSGKPGSR